MVDAIRRSRAGTPAIQRERQTNWTAARRESFLDQLAATCNVTMACAAIGVKPVSAYTVRRRDPAFAEQWRMALLTGYDRLEAKLVEHALKALGETEAVEVPEVPFEARIAMYILKLYHARLHAGASVKTGGPKLTRSTAKDTDQAILKQLAILDRRRKATDA